MAGLEVLSKFKIIVPEDFRQEGFFTRFCAKYRKKFYYITDEITDKSFIEPNCALIPEEELFVEVIGVSQNDVGIVASLYNCQDFLRKRNAISAGLAGFILAWKFGKLSKERFTMCIDRGHIYSHLLYFFYNVGIGQWKLDLIPSMISTSNCRQFDNAYCFLAFYRKQAVEFDGGREIRVLFIFAIESKQIFWYV